MDRKYEEGEPCERCHAADNCTWGPDPHLLMMGDDDSWWLCSECREEAQDEVRATKKHGWVN